MHFKHTVRKLLKSCGLDVRRISKSSDRHRTHISETYALIGQLGFKPKTVVDVGVASGTPELYESFPEAYFLLLEPLKEFESDINSVLKKYKGSYVQAAAGSKQGQVTFNVHEDHLEGSSLYSETMGSEADGRQITVEMVKIDDVLAEKKLVGPYLIKVDIQGAELDALDGAQNALAETEVVVLEVSLFEFMKGAPQFHDVVLYMKNQGFVAYDIIHGWNRPLDNALGQVDIVFVKEDGMFRQDHSYSTITQINSSI